jgi:hypothetical protein
MDDPTLRFSETECYQLLDTSSVTAVGGGGVFRAARAEKLEPLAAASLFPSQGGAAS